MLHVLETWTPGARLQGPDRQAAGHRASREKHLPTIKNRVSVVSLLWEDLLGFVEPTKANGGDAPPVANPSKERRGAGNSKEGWPLHPPESALYAPTTRLSPVVSRLPSRG